MMTNTTLLRTTMEYVTDYPKQLDLDVWWDAQNKTACIAGWAGYFAGHSFDGYYTTCHRVHNHPRMSVDAIAQLELHLTDREADKLFTCITRRQIWRVVKKITRGELTKKSIRRNRSNSAWLPQELRAPTTGRRARAATVCHHARSALARTKLGRARVL